MWLANSHPTVVVVVVVALFHHEISLMREQLPCPFLVAAPFTLGHAPPEAKAASLTRDEVGQQAKTRWHKRWGHASEMTSG